MRRKTALLLSGLVTAFVMTAVVGLMALSGQFSAVAQAAPASSVVVADPNTTDVKTLQDEVASYKAALQKAYTDLQTAYDQIKTLNNQVQTLSAQAAQPAQGGQGEFGRRRFRDDGGQGNGGFIPFVSPSGSDD